MSLSLSGCACVCVCEWEQQQLNYVQVVLYTYALISFSGRTRLDCLSNSNKWCVIYTLTYPHTHAHRMPDWYRTNVICNFRLKDNNQIINRRQFVTGNCRATNSDHTLLHRITHESEKRNSNRTGEKKTNKTQSQQHVVSAPKLYLALISIKTVLHSNTGFSTHSIHYFIFIHIHRA